MRRQRQTLTIATLSDLSDEPRSAQGFSPRLDALLSQLPNYTRTRADHAIYRTGARTLTALCGKTRAELLRAKNVGKKSIVDLENTLAKFGLTLAQRTAMKQNKHLTPGQRVANPVWLREQIRELVEDCGDNIREDEELAEKERDPVRRARYEASVDCHRHWKKQLQRILTGKTSAESLADTLVALGVQP